jgi:3-dehydroquinate synthase
MMSSLKDNLKRFSVSIPALPAAGYDIYIGSGFLSGLRTVIQEQFAGRSGFVITDRSLVRAGHLNAFLGGAEMGVYVIDPPGEASKNMQTLTSILEAMESRFLGRDTLVIALGGGTVGDIAGFAAAVFKRGVPVVQIPTTTVSQADSAIGGKTGVDSSLSKNAFGVFWHPAAVYIDTATLATLEERQYRAGLAESVKHAAIADAGYFAWLEENADALLRRETAALEHLAMENCRIKAAVVAEDPTEKNKRRILNYGHTIGHAIESASGFELLHGEAVAIGMIAAGWMEREMGLADADRLRRLESLLTKLGLPIRVPPSASLQKILELLKLDKKSIGQRPRFVLLEKLGSVLCRNGQWAQEVDERVVLKVMKQMHQG